MPREKDLKRLVRARMEKTGEAYTAARAQVLDKKSKSASSPHDLGKVAGMSDDAVKAKTGSTWAGWIRSLDRDGAATMTHREIAQLVRAKYEVGSWWGQMVAVGYERIKGLRTRGQRRDGSYEATKSRTFNVPVERLFAAWSDARTRRRWLLEPDVKVRTATAPKSIRLGWSDGSIIAVGFTTKGDGKSSVAISQPKLATREDVAAVKRFWSERFDALSEVLSRS